MFVFFPVVSSFSLTNFLSVFFSFFFLRVFLLLIRSVSLIFFFSPEVVECYNWGIFRSFKTYSSREENLRNLGDANYFRLEAGVR